MSLDLTKKKKKKSVKIKTPAEEGGSSASAAAGGEDLDLSIELGKKKKKKKSSKKTAAEDFGDFGGEGLGEGGDAGEGGEGPGGEGGAGGLSAAHAAAAALPWAGSDRDYTYQELLDRVFGILRENNPELTGERRRTTLKPPQVAREGTKKTVFANFMDLCRSMNRNPEHVQAFLLAELGTSGSLDGQQRLIVKGRFLPKAFEGVLRRYVNEYVLCNSCKSPDTLLDRDPATRIMFMRCQQCGASRTVSAIKAGFQARTVSRKSQIKG